MPDKFYITTTLPYVNADPHLGFALEIVQADAIARYHKLLGEEVFFNTGTDEHGVKIQRKAEEQGRETQGYVDEYAAKFKNLMPALGISQDIHFIRTTEPRHKAAVQVFWKKCLDNGDIYKQAYKVKYCVGCELEKTDSELVDGKCPIHPNLEIELIEEENYFFKFSKYQQPLLKFYEANPEFVVPDFRFNEIKRFVESGLQDFSISRLKEKMPWGIPVPDDDSQVMYVWFDALINYISTLGWPENEQQFGQFWPGVQIAGKDNLRQQSAMWQAMLMSAGLPNSKQIIIHGFITSGGQKMSKSLGNVADPYEILSKLKEKGLSEEQAIDALRYYLLREVPTFEDGDYTWERFQEAYNAGLANGIGNQASRILKLAVSNQVLPPQGFGDQDYRIEAMGKYRLKEAMDEIWKSISECDEYIQRTEPFKKIKTDPEAAKEDILHTVFHLRAVAERLRAFLPYTSEKLLAVLRDPKLENIPRLFPRIE
ncbi:MAG: methionine--tRNA ligase [Patescibacteria group bacterium]|nr:methionine--tRNA ligase [Patescibacteria group bacterium]